MKHLYIITYIWFDSGDLTWETMEIEWNVDLVNKAAYSMLIEYYKKEVKKRFHNKFDKIIYINKLY